MTAHIVYEAWDPDRPATCSPIVIDEIIRGRIGFQGLLMSDDLDMKALQYALNGGLEAARGSGAWRGLRRGAAMFRRAEGDAGDGQGLPRAGRPGAGARARRGSFAKRPPREFDAEAGWARFKQLAGDFAPAEAISSRERRRRPDSNWISAPPKRRRGARRSCSRSMRSKDRCTCCSNWRGRRKIDLAKVSVGEIADQYLAFIAEARVAQHGDRRRLSGDGRVAGAAEVAPADPEAATAGRRARSAAARRGAAPKADEPRARARWRRSGSKRCRNSGATCF